MELPQARQQLNMKIYFISSDFALYRDNIVDSRYHFGLASLVSCLKEQGHQPRYFYYHAKSQHQLLFDEIKHFSPDIVGLTVVESQWPYLKELAKEIKRFYRGPIICGGAYASLCPEEVAGFSSIDAVLAGEGEVALSQVLKLMQAGKDWHSACNLFYYDSESGRAVSNPLAPLIDDLDSLPFPDRNFHLQSLSYDSFIKDESSRVGFDLAFKFSRGCPFGCSYCCCAELSRRYSRGVRLPRFHSPDYCLEEIGRTVGKNRLRKPIIFLDDVLTINKDWLFSFLGGYRRRFGIKFACRSRVEVVDEEILKTLKKSGCYSITMSIESGNDYIRNEIMKREVSKEKIYATFKTAHKLGLETVGASLIGVPFETKEMIEETIEVVAKTNTQDCYVGIFYPYEGTELCNLAKKEGLLMNKKFLGRMRAYPAIESLQISKNELMNFYNNWKKYVMAKKSFALKLTALVRKCFRNSLEFISYFLKSFFWKK
jgi:radical SAM superfamily enzyme YgiQ (UPF0313 family)